MCSQRILETGGLYIFLTRHDVYDWRWGLYLHYSTQHIPIPKSNQDTHDFLEVVVPSKKGVAVHMGKRYHVHDLGEGYIVNHETIDTILLTPFLVSLLRVGIIRKEQWQMVDNLIEARGAKVITSTGGESYSRRWVMQTVHELSARGYLELKTGELYEEMKERAEGRDPCATEYTAEQPMTLRGLAVFNSLFI